MIRQLIIIAFILFVFNSCTKTETDQLINSANHLLQNDNLSDYRGWVKYLMFDVEVVAERAGCDEQQVKEKQKRLKNWIHKIEETPNILQTLRGTHEWAYESPADGSGQPFMITIPQDYDPQKPFPVSIYMHGYSGNHSEFYSGSDKLKGIIELSVLGRSRGGGYVGLSEADVLHVLDYVESHWNVDSDRIHLSGGSMGGHGTYRLGSRFPHRFASARPTCGFASDKAYENMLTLPIYATHSDDDYVVPIYHSEGPVKLIQALNGPAIFDGTTGLGHASWDYSEGNARSNEWFRKQKRPYTRNIKNLNYTAFDGEATRSWWAEVKEWGNQPKPAKFILNASENNHLDAMLINIRQLKLYLNESPFDLQKDLYVSINQDSNLIFESPLPNEIHLQYKNRKWQLVNQVKPASIRKHTPGGPNMLYNGEPLLIVYGTRGNRKEKAAMLEAAKVASKSGNAVWSIPNGEYGSDSIQHNQNLYGDLNIKADIDVKKADIEKYHLILIGTKSQNTIVASIADRLPVFLSNNKITFSDNETYSADDIGLGLLYYNPDSPQKLIFWVASNDLSIYKAGSPIPNQMVFAFQTYTSAPSGHDCLLVNSKNSMIVASRNFDSNWNLIPRKRDGAIVSSKLKTNLDFNNAFGHSIQKITSSDFAFSLTSFEDTTINNNDLPSLLLEDLSSRYFFEPIGIITLKGEELLTLQDNLNEKKLSLYPVPDREVIDSEKEYTLALNQNSIWSLVRTTQSAPGNYQLTDIQLSTAINMYFPRE